MKILWCNLNQNKTIQIQNQISQDRLKRINQLISKEAFPFYLVMKIIGMISKKRELIN